MNRGLAAQGRDGYHLVATGVTTGLVDSAGRLEDSVAAIRELFTTSFGYAEAEGFGRNMRVQQLRETLREFAKRRSPTDTVVLYHTGHADVVDDEHRLWMGDTVDAYSQTLRTAELVSLLLANTPLRRLMVILDACYAGEGGAQSLTAALRAGRHDDKTLVLVTSAHPTEQVRAGDFAGLFREAVEHPSTAGHEPEFLDPGILVGHIERNPRRPGWQTVSESTLFNTEDVPTFLPNPRYDPRFHEVDLLTRLRVEQERLREEELHQHFGPRARGVISPVEGNWRFEGRHSALRRIVGALPNSTASTDSGRSLPEEPVLVVTGDPGSGKSAVLGRIVLLSDRKRRGSVPLDGVPRDTLPPIGEVDGAVHARGMTTGQVLRALCAVTGVIADSAGELLAGLGERRLVVVIDSLDEAIDPQGLAKELIRPLVDAAPDSGLRLLLGTRRHTLDLLGDRHAVLDLDAEEYADSASVARYARHCLTEASTNSPYRDAPESFVGEVAEAIASAAGRSFLVTLIASTSLALRAELPDPHDPTWRAALPRTAAEAMREDLEVRLGADAAKAVQLMTPLAFAQGSGLPWEDLWAGLASRLSGRHFTDTDIVWLRDQAGCYIVEAVTQGRSVYRLYHRAMAEYVVQYSTPEEVHAGFTAFLTERVPKNHHREWSRAHPYTRRHIATHAARGNALDALLDDPSYLVAAEPDELLNALPAAGSPSARAAAAAYKRSAHRMTDAFDAPSYLQLSAYRVGAPEQARTIADRFPDAPWSVSWALWRRETPHRVLGSFPEPIEEVRTVHTPQDGTAPARPAQGGTVFAAIHGSRLVVDPVKGTGEVGLRLTRRATLTRLWLHQRPDGEVTALVLDTRRQLTVVDLATMTPVRRIRLPSNDSVAARLAEYRDLLRSPGEPDFPDRYARGELGDATVAVTFSGSRADAWNLANGRRLRTVQLRKEERLPFHVHHVRMVEPAHPDNDILAAMERPDGKELDQEVTVPIGDGRSLVLSPDAIDVIGVADDTADDPTLRLVGHHRGLISIDRATGPGAGSSLITGSGDGTIRAWDLDEVRHSALPDENGALDTSPWSHATADPESGEVVLGGTPLVRLDPLDGRVSRFAPGPAGVLTALTVARIGAPTEARSAVLACRALSNGCNWEVWDIDTGEILGDDIGGGTYAYAVAAAQPASGTTVAVSVGHGSRAVLWHVSHMHQDNGITARTTAKRRLAHGHTGWTSCVATGTTPKGRDVAVTGGHDGRICVWSLPRGRLVKRFLAVPHRWWPVPTRRWHIRDVAYAVAPGGTPVIVALGETGIVSVWHPRTARLLGQLNCEDTAPKRIAVRRRDTGGLLMAAVSEQGCVHVWRLAVTGPALTRRCSFSLTHTVHLEAAARGLLFTDDRSLLVVMPHGLVKLDLSGA